ncbi:hypothetical protein BDZ45DRAFT_693214 [Acephala macrosclerotiorum]|nr:hypothetical protein BDZ45DRAFT_693214 [Acephala macrosclerotiorum]
MSTGTDSLTKDACLADRLTPWATDLWAPFPRGTAKRRNNLRRIAGRELHHNVMYGHVRSQKRWPILVDSFEILSQRYEDSGCEDSRDLIFALLSISKEVVLGRGITVDCQKNMKDTLFALLARGGTGPIALNSRIRFATLTASVMKFSWPGYILEARILYEYQSVELKNVAQFMEIFLDEIDPSVWRSPENSYAMSKGGGGSPAKKLNKKEDRNLGQVLHSLKIPSSLRLTEKDKVENSETDIEDEYPEADWEKLQAESEILARPRIPRPPWKTPERR